jgi:hypothetical protein
MLEVRNGGLTIEGEQAHFSLWVISKSPLLIGTNLATISNTGLAVLLNAAVIAINQNSLGVAATTFQSSGQAAPVSGTLYPYWSGVISDGYVFGIVAANSAVTLTVNFSNVPGLVAGTYSWTEAYIGATGAGTSVGATLALHYMAIFHVKKSVTSVTTTAKSVSSTSRTKTSATSSKSTTTTASSTGTIIAEWGQCARIGWTRSGTCEFSFLFFFWFLENEGGLAN